MNPFTVEEINLLSIYNGKSKEEVTEKIAFALSFMDSDMRELAKHTVKKVNSLSDEEFAALSIDPADDAFYIVFRGFNVFAYVFHVNFGGFHFIARFPFIGYGQGNDPEFFHIFSEIGASAHLKHFEYTLL